MTDPDLAALYPFLAAGTPAGLEEGLRDSIRMKAQDHERVVAAFFAAQGADVVAAARTIARAYQGGGRLFAMGNGGSSCDAAHIAVEFLHPVTTGRPALPAQDLGGDTAMISAVANDVGYAHVFARQLIALGRHGDVVLGLSTSGNSANLLSGFERARAMGIATIGLCGTDGGAMARAGLDHCLVVPSDSIHRVQEVHLVIYHVLWDLVHTLLAAERGVSHGATP